MHLSDPTRAKLTGMPDRLAPEAARLGVDLGLSDPDDDDHRAAKFDLLADLAIPVVSFTFGLPLCGRDRELAGCRDRRAGDRDVTRGGAGRRRPRRRRARRARPGVRRSSGDALRGHRTRHPPTRRVARGCSRGHRAAADRGGRAHVGRGCPSRARSGRPRGAMRHGLPALPGGRHERHAPVPHLSTAVHREPGHPGLHGTRRPRVA